jgi:hypothetical protein
MPQKQVDDHWIQHFHGCADFKKTTCCIGIAKHGSALLGLQSVDGGCSRRPAPLIALVSLF